VRALEGFDFLGDFSSWDFWICSGSTGGDWEGWRSPFDDFKEYSTTCVGPCKTLLRRSSESESTSFFFGDRFF